MGRSLSALAALAVLFTLLWAPIGQQAFLAEHWMKIGTFAAPMLLFMALTNRGPDAGPWLGDPKLMATLLLCSYLLHQFEEHWVDLLGRLYPLRDMLNEMLAKYAGDAARGAMSGEAIFYINTGVVWLVGFLGIWRAPDHLFPSLAMAGVMIVNAVFHVLNTVADHAYNPGLATGLILFLPLSLAYATALVRAGRVGVAVVLAG
ncbi:MAG: HXXEE domain-containing protein, partial [Pseudomonadota bacterium]